ncbi:protein Cep89 homolog [Chironomus tepperi]|uniref:protein Cep89 homolog n=1 Tax=Chironomus tepperi TaxID=113505 RepID=UPI00391EF7BA
MDRSSRKEKYSANFDSQLREKKTERSKSLESNQKINQINKELRYWINIKDNQIQELVAKITHLLEENDTLRNEKSILIKNHNLLIEKIGEQSKEDEREEKHEMLIKENEDLKNDLKMLKVLIFRLNKHVDYYQEILNEKKEDLNPPTKYSNEKEIISSWTVNSHLLAPLMNSYEERVKEKNEIIKNYEMELNQFSMKLKKILEENEKIHEINEDLYRNSKAWLSQKERLTSQCEILKNKAAIHAKRADLSKEKLVEILKAYEQKIQSLNLDIERLQEAYNRSKGEISTLKNLQKNPEAVTQSVKECQKLLEELKDQFEVEKAYLIGDLGQQREKAAELENLLKKQKLCNETLIERNKVLKQSIHHEKLARENLKKDVDQYELGNEAIRNLHNMVQEKEIQMQNMRFTHLKEMEDLRMKLQKRDETLRKVLQVKVSESTKS